MSVKEPNDFPKTLEINSGKTAPKNASQKLLYIKKLLVICYEIPHTQIHHHVMTTQLNGNRSQSPRFHKTLEQGIIKTDSSHSN